MKMTNSVVMKLSQFFKYTFLLCSSMRLRLHDPPGENGFRKTPLIQRIGEEDII